MDLIPDRVSGDPSEPAGRAPSSVLWSSQNLLEFCPEMKNFQTEALRQNGSALLERCINTQTDQNVSSEFIESCCRFCLVLILASIYGLKYKKL